MVGFVQIPVHGVVPPQLPLSGCVQTPPLHTSFVHELLSLAHAAVLFGWVQAPLLHTSLVHTLPSSVHAAVLFGWVHAPVALHTSFVQTLLSVAHAVPLAAGTNWQTPDTQLSV